jgi:hypothetical protein
MQHSHHTMLRVVVSTYVYCQFLLIALKNIARHPSLRVASTSKHMRLRLAAGSTTLSVDQLQTPWLFLIR